MRLFLGAIGALVLLDGCSWSAQPAADTTPRQPRIASVNETRSVNDLFGTQEIRVTGDEGRGPEICRPEKVGRIVAGFFEAVSRGEADRVADFFAPKASAAVVAVVPTGFTWYSMTEGNPRRHGHHFVTHERNKLQGYFEERAVHKERMYLLEIAVKHEPVRDRAHAVFSLHRTADDLGNYAPQAEGKGVIECEGGRIEVWSMGQARKPLPVGIYCPGRADPPDVAIACGR